MKNHPFVKALAAEMYIIVFALGIWFTSEQVNPNFEPGPMVAVITFLSLFVFSAACMGYLFLGEPIALALGGNAKEGVKYFLQTLGYFAVLAAVTVAFVWGSVLVAM
jgi:hypothetical protein